MAKVEIDQLTKSFGTLLEIETPEERTARLDRETKDADQQRFFAKWLFIGGSVLSAVLFVASTWCAFFGTDPVQRWAQSVVTLFAGGLVGYLVGAAKKDSK